jgi:PKD domain-containing protein
VHGTPAVALDGQGDAVAVWQTGVEEKIEAAVRPAAEGAWQAPVVISPEGAVPSGPQVAVDAAGDAVAVWSDRESSSGNSVWASVRSPVTGVWSPAERLSEVGEPGRSSLHPVVAFGDEGDAVAMWEAFEPERVPGAHKVIEAIVRPSVGAAWRAPTVVATHGREPRLGVAASGEAVAVWQGEGGVYAATLPASSSTWAAAVPVVESEAGNPRVAVDARGDAVAVWESTIGGWGSTPGTNTIQAAVKLAGGAWGAPVNISEPVEYSHLYPELFPDIAVSPQGSAIAVWDGYGYTPNGWSVQGAALPAIDGSWQPRVQIAGTPGIITVPSVGVDEHGNGLVLWQGREGESREGGTELIQTAEYDASSPVLQGVSVPSTGIAGRVLSFAVSPMAMTTALGQTSWSFGDGTPPVTGTSVSHVFAVPGSYRVTVTTADVFGNPTSASSMIQVGPPPQKCRCRVHRRPGLSNVRLVHKRFRAAGRHAGARTGHRSRVPFGTTFRFNLSEPATVQIEIARVIGGHKRVVRCPRSHPRGIGRCAAVQVLGIAKYEDQRKGPDKVYFRGWIDGRPLAAGRYVATLTASNKLGHSRPVNVAFAIVR